MNHTGGGLAQMPYQPNNHFESALGVPGSGFASRRGRSQVFNNRLSAAPPSNITTIKEFQPQNGVSTPRTSRSHLLAGLRTAPKSPMCPTSAPPTQVQQPFHLNAGRYNSREQSKLGNGVPHTAVGQSFGNKDRGVVTGGIVGGSLYGLPEILAPPEIQSEEELNTVGMDPELYAELMANGQYLAQQQMVLQQQLHNLTVAQQQMQGLSLGRMEMAQQQQQHYTHSSIAPTNGYYNQQLQSGLQPVVTQIPGTPGLYSVFNPMTGQQSLMMDPAGQTRAPAPAPAPTSAQAPAQPLAPTYDLAHSPSPTTPTFHAQVSPPPESNAPVRTFRSPSPPKAASPPVQVNPLPPPSAGAFRRGHLRQLSSVTGLASKADNGPKSSVPKTATFPMTPMTGTFGPGQSRAGDHPVRQPRGPPSLEELVEKPTSKHEGSKNFVARQRRQRCHALNGLVRAGMERRGVSRGSNSIDSPGTGTPSSECEINFSVSSDTDNDSVGSSSGASSSSVHGAIGSELKMIKEHSRERSPTDTPNTTASAGSEEEIGGKTVEIQGDGAKEGPRSAPLLVLTSAEKRKSAIF
ncbi:MAG: hypothetical protein Q9163_004687 [Psora crenata]